MVLPKYDKLASVHLIERSASLCLISVFNELPVFFRCRSFDRPVVPLGVRNPHTHDHRSPLLVQRIDNTAVMIDCPASFLFTSAKDTDWED